MAPPAIAGVGSFLAHLGTVSPNAYFQCNRCTVGCPLAPVVDLTPAQVVHYLLLGDWEPALLNHRTTSALARSLPPLLSKNDPGSLN